MKVCTTTFPLLTVALLFIACNLCAQKTNSGLQIECYPYQNKLVDSILLDGKIYHYKMIQTRVLYKKGITNFTASEIILPEFNNLSDSVFVSKLLHAIMHNDPCDEVAAFTDCLARELYYDCKNLQTDEADYFKKHFVGYFPIRKKSK